MTTAVTGTGPAEPAAVTAAEVADLRIYPVKGLSGQRLRSVRLAAGHGFPHDREYALARRGGRFRPGEPATYGKRNFHMLMRDAALASCATHVDGDGRLTVRRHGATVLEADLTEAAGAAATEEFFGRLLGLSPDRAPVLVRGRGERFPDLAPRSAEDMNAVSLINLASVRDFADRIGRRVDPLRFRANVYLDGPDPFAEFGLVGRELVAGTGDGAVRLRVVRRTGRCAATTVDPATAERDLSVPKLLQDTYGHTDMGVYATVVAGGELAVGTTLRPR